MRTCRRNGAFTLVELLVVVIIIGIIATIAVANLVGAKEKAFLAGVKDNMHTVQVAAEGYHTETNTYAQSAADLDPFFPNGAFRVGGTAGNRPVNPFTNASGEAPYTESLTSSVLITDARQQPPQGGGGNVGQVGYCPADGNESYAVCGLDASKKRMANPGGGTLVLSNQ
jgi:prepilin-type N-terminal cleavage/methylation domain-containing protein